MKKQILSAVLLTAMVGVSVAEAGFTDDLRAKLAGKDFTMQYVQKYDFANPNIADVGDKFTFTRQGKNFAVKHDFAKYVKQGNVWKLNGYTNHKAYMESIDALPNDYPYYDIRDGFTNSFFAEYDGWQYALNTGYDVGLVLNIKKYGLDHPNQPLMNVDCNTTVRILLFGEQQGKLPKPVVKNIQYGGENLIMEEYEMPLVEQEQEGAGKTIIYYNPKFIKMMVKVSDKVTGVSMKAIKQTVRMYYRSDGSLAYFDAITSHPNGAKYRVDVLDYKVDNSMFDYLKRFTFDKSQAAASVKAQ
ncbi:MAG: hypothetical protein MJ048_03050 [Acidaminococcaceae bacterium]|nr:hypothetical protein [Acidaminococcaceae bacterium]